jgi:hypothetical protein
MFLYQHAVRNPKATRDKQMFRYRCDSCSKEYDAEEKAQKRRFQFCSKPCFGRHKREHPELWRDSLPGKHRPDMMRKAADSFRQTVASGLYRPGHHPRTPETRAMIGAAARARPSGMKGHHHPESSKAHMSLIGTHRFREGKMDFGSSRTESGYHDSPKAGRCWYRSSWERKVMEALDASGDVVVWEHEPFTLPFRYNDNLRHYLPDFSLVRRDGSCEVWEVKPLCRIDGNEKLRAQARTARGWCEEQGCQFRVMTEWELRGEGVQVFPDAVYEWPSVVHRRDTLLALPGVRSVLGRASSPPACSAPECEP